MIRNYYTEAYKNGIVPVISSTQLIDGTVKIKESVAVAAHPLNLATSVTIILAATYPDIKPGMYITAPAAGGNAAWTINDTMMVEAAVIAGGNTTITLNKGKAVAANAGLTFFGINQGSWKPYNLFIGTSPSQQNDFGSITSATANAAAGAQKVVTWKVSNPYVQAGMTAYDDGVSLGLVDDLNSTVSLNLVTNVPGGGIADASILTFSFTELPSIQVLTVDNKTVTFTNPAEGFVLPVTVVQVISVAGGLTNLIAVE
jgi:hypothetical protein